MKTEHHLTEETASAAVKWSEEGRHLFETVGLPTSRMEAYKYTPLKTLLPKDLTYFTEKNPAAVSPLSDPGLSPYVLHFCDGALISVSEELAKTAGISVKPNTEAGKNGLDELLTLPDIGSDPMYAHAKTSWYKGVHIQIQKNTVLEHPLVIIQNYSAENNVHAGFNFITAGEFAQMEVIEINLNAHSHFSNIATLMLLKNEARVNYHLLHSSPGLNGVRSIQAHLGKSAFLCVNSFALNNNLLRINVKVALEGEGAQADLHGLYQARGEQHIDHQVEIRHLLPHCPSNQLFKGMLNGASTGVFNGRIYVAKDAQKTNAFQKSKALLLSEDARIYTKPELEIFADDVKCSHGAAVGQMNEDELFYLQARGLNKEEAMQLLLNAYAAEVAEKVQTEVLRNFIEHHIRLALNQENV